MKNSIQNKVKCSYPALIVSIYSIKFISLKMKLPKILSHDKLHIDEKRNKYVTPYYIPMSKTDRTLVFESRFESGNL